MSDTATAHEPIDPSFVAMPRPSVQAFAFDAEMVLYDESIGTLHHLNPQAALVWRCLDGSGPLSELVLELSDAYGVDPETVERDVLGLVTHLARSNLLEGVGPEAAPDSADHVPPNFLAEPPSP